jgi:[acyl-carrier-protein] S-malonyltransferase
MSANEPTFKPRILYIFPGQGSQYKGMGSDLYEEYASARQIYDQARGILGYDITTLSFRDPKEELDFTRFTQPALLTHQIACYTVFKDLMQENCPTPFAAAGHSLGEYAALVIAGALSFTNALKLVQKRGELMSEHGEGVMLALPLDLKTAQNLADKYYCGVASCNLPAQNVVGGTAEDIESLATEIAEKFPRQRPILLKTEGAFHTYFMVTAARHFRFILDSIELSKPTIRVLSNYTGSYHETEISSIRSRLFFQLFNPVNWTKCLQTAIDDGVTTFIEFGGGIGRSEEPQGKRPNLESIIKKTSRAAKLNSLYLPAINCQTIEETSALLQKQTEAI